jgi:hypothetical protein
MVKRSLLGVTVEGEFAKVYINTVDDVDCNSRTCARAHKQNDIPLDVINAVSSAPIERGAPAVQ